MSDINWFPLLLKKSLYFVASVNAFVKVYIRKLLRNTLLNMFI